MEIVGWSSVYIPYLDERYSADELKYMFETKYNIGKIKRIDLVQSVKKRVKTAFIHFETWYFNDFTTVLRRELETRGKYNLTAYATYLHGKIETHSECKTCLHLYQHKLSAYSNEIDDITLLIHRTKYTHTHNMPVEKEVILSHDSMDTLPLSQTSTLQNRIERHDKRIALLEDEIQVLVEYYNKMHR